MPSNKRSEPEAEKRAQLVTAARELFVRDGYESTSMGRIAEAARVTPNTIYWYFDDKDELLLAVLEQLFQEHLVGYLSVAGEPLSEQVLWLVRTLRGFSRLISTVHARVRESTVLAGWHEQFHRTVEQMLGLQLPPSLSKQTIAAEIRIAGFTVEGLVTHEVEDSELRLICETLAARWAGR